MTPSVCGGPPSGFMNTMCLYCKDCLGCFYLILPPGLSSYLKESEGKEFAKISAEDSRMW